MSQGKVKDCLAYLVEATNQKPKEETIVKAKMEILVKKHQEEKEWMESVIVAKDDARHKAQRDNDAAIRELKEQKELVVVSREGEKQSREEQVQLQKQLEDIRRETSQLQGQMKDLQEELKHNKAATLIAQKEKSQLEEVVEVQGVILFGLEHIIDNWEKEMAALKEDTIKSKV